MDDWEKRKTIPRRIVKSAWKFRKATLPQTKGQGKLRGETEPKPAQAWKPPKGSDPERSEKPKTTGLLPKMLVTSPSCLRLFLPVCLGMWSPGLPAIPAPCLLLLQWLLAVTFANAWEQNWTPQKKVSVRHTVCLSAHLVR